jgi:hypothetical protein
MQSSRTPGCPWHFKSLDSGAEFKACRSQKKYLTLDSAPSRNIGGIEVADNAASKAHRKLASEIKIKFSPKAARHGQRPERFPLLPLGRCPTLVMGERGEVRGEKGRDNCGGRAVW